MCDTCQCCKRCGCCNCAEADSVESRSRLDGYAPWARLVMSLGTLVASLSLTVGYFAFLGRVMMYPGADKAGPPWGWIAMGSAVVVRATWAFAYRDDEETAETEARS